MVALYTSILVLIVLILGLIALINNLESKKSNKDGPSENLFGQVSGTPNKKELLLMKLIRLTRSKDIIWQYSRNIPCEFTFKNNNNLYNLHIDYDYYTPSIDDTIDVPLSIDTNWHLELVVTDKNKNSILKIVESEVSPSLIKELNSEIIKQIDASSGDIIDTLIEDLDIYGQTQQPNIDNGADNKIIIEKKDGMS